MPSALAIEETVAGKNIYEIIALTVIKLNRFSVCIDSSNKHFMN